MQNFYIKKKKTKYKAAKLIANQYLSNINLNDSINENIFENENIESNHSNKKYKIFLYLNTIKSNKTEQTDYFNCYKEKLRAENVSKNQVLDFIKNEFQSNASNEKPLKLEASLKQKKPNHCVNDDTEADYYESMRRKNEHDVKSTRQQRNTSSSTTVSLLSKSNNGILTR